MQRDLEDLWARLPELSPEESRRGPLNGSLNILKIPNTKPAGLVPRKPRPKQKPEIANAPSIQHAPWNESPTPTPIQGDTALGIPTTSPSTTRPFKQCSTHPHSPPHPEPHPSRRPVFPHPSNTTNSPCSSSFLPNPSSSSFSMPPSPPSRPRSPHQAQVRHSPPHPTPRVAPAAENPCRICAGGAVGMVWMRRRRRRRIGGLG